MRAWFDGIIKAKLFTFTKTLMIFQDLIIYFFSASCICECLLLHVHPCHGMSMEVFGQLWDLTLTEMVSLFLYLFSKPIQ